jgi:RHS repeat-associated protein
VFDASFVPKSASNYVLTRTFTGQYYDRDTGLMLYRNRVYHPILGRFVQRDPIGYEAGDVNLMRYVGNKEDRFVDTWGLQRVITDLPKIQINPNGSTTITYPDGTEVTDYPNGDHEVELPDNSTVITRPDGTVIVIDPNGEIAITYPDGTQEFTPNFGFPPNNNDRNSNQQQCPTSNSWWEEQIEKGARAGLKQLFKHLKKYSEPKDHILSPPYPKTLNLPKIILSDGTEIILGIGYPDFNYKDFNSWGDFKNWNSPSDWWDNRNQLKPKNNWKLEIQIPIDPKHPKPLPRPKF